METRGEKGLKIAGVICEYNPFHNGHARHLRLTREASGCDYIVCCMAGAFTQRGEPAIVDKFLRAEMALRCGADAVVAALYGETPITGRLPFQIPADMEQVLAQREDLPKDLENPLFDYGFGMDVAAFGK